MTVATAPNGARLLLLPLDHSLQPAVTIGDTAPHTTYWPHGKPTEVLRREDGHDQKHGRGWTGRSGHKLLPAPAVTYTGSIELPTTITVAVIPLAPGADEAELADITSRAEGENTVWALPTREGSLEFVASDKGCSVVE